MCIGLERNPNARLCLEQYLRLVTVYAILLKFVRVLEYREIMFSGDNILQTTGVALS